MAVVIHHFRRVLQRLIGPSEVSSLRYICDVGRLAGLDANSPRQAAGIVQEFRDRAGQGCFICLECPKRGDYAVLVPCLRPTSARKVVGYSGMFSDDPEPIYGNMPWENACESDNDIFQRLVDTCYQYQGRWKKWLPYYGITDVLEVNVRLYKSRSLVNRPDLEVQFYFAGVIDPDGRYPIRMYPVDLENILEECEKTIARHPVPPYLEFIDVCVSDYAHSKECLIGMEHSDQPCILVSAEKAEQRRNRLLFLSLLKDCARDPSRASGLRTLEGMAQESCIYDLRGPDRVAIPLPHQRFQGTDQTRGLHFVLGFQKDRMRVELPFKVSCAWFGIAVTWLCVVLWMGKGGDWGTALAFAQVVAASISIVISCL